MSSHASVAVVIGLAVGLLVGLTSVGGGSLMTPALIGIFGLSPLAAVGTDLLYQTVTRGVGGLVHVRQHSVDRRVLGRLAAGSLPGALVAAALLRAIPAGAARGHAVLIALSLVLILSAAVLAVQPPRARTPAERSARPARPGAITALGAAVGLTVGLTSVGAGALTMPVLLVLCPLLSTRELVGTDLAHSALLLPLAAAVSSATPLADLHLLVPLLVGSIPGALAGGRLSARVPERPLRVSMAGVLLYTGIRLIPL